MCPTEAPTTTPPDYDDRQALIAAMIADDNVQYMGPAELGPIADAILADLKRRGRLREQVEVVTRDNRGRDPDTGIWFRYDIPGTGTFTPVNGEAFTFRVGTMDTESDAAAPAMSHTCDIALGERLIDETLPRDQWEAAEERKAEGKLTLTEAKALLAKQRAEREEWERIQREAYAEEAPSPAPHAEAIRFSIADSPRSSAQGYLATGTAGGSADRHGAPHAEAVTILRRMHYSLSSIGMLLQKHGDGSWSLRGQPQDLSAIVTEASECLRLSNAALGAAGRG